MAIKTANYLNVPHCLGTIQPLNDSRPPQGGGFKCRSQIDAFITCDFYMYLYYLKLYMTMVIFGKFQYNLQMCQYEKKIMKIV